MRDGKKGEAFQEREQYEQSVRGMNNCRQFYRIKAKGAWEARVMKGVGPEWRGRRRP